MEETCDLCKEINLTSLQAYHHAKSLDAPLQRRREQFRADCPLCRFLLSRFPETNEGRLLVGMSIRAARQRDWFKSAGTLLRGVAVKTSSFLPRMGYTQYYPLSRIALGGQYQDFTKEWKRDIRVFVDTTSSSEQRSHVAGRPVLPPGCRQSTQAIASWLDECQSKHDKCRRSLSGSVYGNDSSSGTALPKRSINVGLRSHYADPIDPVVFVETTEGQQGRYATLSYCWGPSQPTSPPLMLKKENANQLQRSVTVSHLPKTIQDAIAVTRQLNTPYLWVDRLCIVQNDVTDWEEQAEKMCEIYEGSHITISAFGAEGGGDGLFLPRGDVPSVRIPCATSTKVMGDMSVAYPCGPSDPRFEGCSSFEAELRTNAWNSRGWIMQERLLSRRIVHFGKFQLYWECQETSRNEDGTDDGSDRVWSYHGYQSKAIFHTNCSFHWIEKIDFLPGLRNSMDIWESLVRDYSGRQLSVASDKLRAIDGIAIAVQKRLRLSEYCCGVWLDGLHRLLLWYPENGLSIVL